MPIIAHDLTSAASLNLIGFTNPWDGAFASAGDGFQVYQRGVSASIPFALADDSISVFPPDTLGIVDETDLDPFFGVVDTVNGDTTGPVTAEWVFDISGSTNLELSIDLAAMGDFESGDVHSLTASIDGGAAATLLSITADEAASQNYTLAGGVVFPLDDPLTVGGTFLSNVFQSFTAAISGAGSSLTLSLTSDADGGSEAFALRDIIISGDAIAGSTTLAIAAADADKDEGDSGTTDFTFTVTRAGDLAGATDVSYAVTSAAADAADFGGALPSGTASFAAGAGTATITIPVAGDVGFEADEAFTVTLSGPTGGAVITGASADGTIRNDDVLPVTLTHDVQGAGAASPLAGQVVAVEAVVVGDFQSGDADASRDLRGFYLQEEDADADADAATSEGIFIFDPGTLLDVNPGDVVRVVGTASEFFGETEIIADEITILSTAALPSAASLSLPAVSTVANANGELIADLEFVEGMRVTLPQTLTVTEMFNLDRFGEFQVSEGGRLEQFTQSNDPDAAGFAAHQEDIARRVITVDDGLSVQNPDPIAYPDGSLDLADGFGMGDTVAGLTGVVRFSRGSGGSGDETYRINPTTAPTFIDANPREAAPDAVGGSLTVASLNVLNYFTTLDLPGEVSGPGGDDPRGADSAEEFARQQEKLVSAIAGIDADIFGLVEIENTDAPGGVDTALANLVDAVNAAVGAGTYDYVSTGFIGSDPIKVGYIYKPTEAAAVGDFAVLDDAAFIDPNATGSDRNRPALAQTFADLDTGGELTIAVNHFKSKGSSGLSGDPATDPDIDQGDGQGFWNDTRAAAANALANWLATDPTGAGDDDYLIIGDLNSYAREDPIKALEAAGYTDLGRAFLGAAAASFVFDGQQGTLDYAMANASLAAQVAGATVWNINSDEPDAIDYNLDFGRNPAIFDGSIPFRASDHDPVIIGLDLLPTVPDANSHLEFDLGGPFGNSRVTAELHSGGPDQADSSSDDALLNQGFRRSKVNSDKDLRHDSGVEIVDVDGFVYDGDALLPDSISPVGPREARKAGFGADLEAGDVIEQRVVGLRLDAEGEGDGDAIFGASFAVKANGAGRKGGYGRNDSKDHEGKTIDDTEMVMFDLKLEGLVGVEVSFSIDVEDAKHSHGHGHGASHKSKGRGPKRDDDDKGRGPKDDGEKGRGPKVDEDDDAGVTVDFWIRSADGFDLLESTSLDVMENEFVSVAATQVFDAVSFRLAEGGSDDRFRLESLEIGTFSDALIV